MDIHPDWSDFLRLLNSHGVEYLIIGAHALAFHGHPRLTGDLDCFVSITVANTDLLKLALDEFGFGGAVSSAEMLRLPNKVFMMGRIPVRIDILNWIDGVAFEDAWSNKVEGKLGDVPVWFISKEDYIRNKRSAGRAKDLADLDALGQL